MPFRIHSFQALIQDIAPFFLSLLLQPFPHLRIDGGLGKSPGERLDVKPCPATTQIGFPSPCN